MDQLDQMDQNKGSVTYWFYGGQGRNRTADASLFRAALYRLSYLAQSGPIIVSAGSRGCQTQPAPGFGRRAWLQA